MSETTTGEQNTGRKWTKETWRVYHRERYRRLNNVKPENQKKLREEVKEDLEKMHPKVYEYYLKNLEKTRERRAKYRKPKVECPVCKVLVCDTEGRWRLHNNTIVHKIAQQTLEKHGLAQTA